MKSLPDLRVQLIIIVHIPIDSQGIVWIATRSVQGVWSQTSSILELTQGPRWWACVNPAEWPAGFEAEARASGLWDEACGDRQQVVVDME